MDRFDAPDSVAAALKVVREGGVLVKTSTSLGSASSTWYSEMVRKVISGVGPVNAGSFFRDVVAVAAEDPFVARPDVTTFCADAMTPASLARSASAAMDDLARSIIEDGMGGYSTILSRRLLLSVPSCVTLPPCCDTVMNASLARYVTETFSSNLSEVLLSPLPDAFQVAPAAVYTHHTPTPAIAERPKSVLVTGGLGAIGIEISLWLAQHHPVRVHLLGRSGRRSQMGGAGKNDAASPDGLGAHAGVVTIHRSDASFAEECSSVAENLRFNASGGFNKQDTLGAVLHASGEACFSSRRESQRNS